ncbi:RCC1 domain-containing protein [Bdellovibrio sp. HCB2-146]|uniref:RCC1 domain-containing protein n=1 Tax=Bdellovibrio sp. HCB2-146 TaxID=3394362 RepID=UPI0039BC5CD4
MVQKSNFHEQRRRFLKLSLLAGTWQFFNLLIPQRLAAFVAPKIARKRTGAWCFWGANTYGQFGNGANGGSFSTPVAVFAGNTWERISASLDSTTAIKNKNELWTFGRNNWGQLGVGNTTGRSSPVHVGSLTSWTALVRGLGPYNMAKQGTSLYGWGQNPEGNIGAGPAPVSVSTPIQISGSWTEVSLGDYHTIGIKADGTLWGWGSNSSGQVGNGSATSVSSPVQIGLGSTFLKVATGLANSYAIRSDGTLWSWGINWSGQLGNGVANGTKVSTPIQVGSLTTWTDIYAGDNVAYGKRNDGTYWCWGYNTEGQLGLGDTSGRSTPVQFPGTTWSEIFPGHGFALGLKSDGTLYSWGDGTGGFLGTGSTANASTPVQIEGTWQKVFVGYNHVGGLRF